MNAGADMCHSALVLKLAVARALRPRQIVAYKGMKPGEIITAPGFNSKNGRFSINTIIIVMISVSLIPHPTAIRFPIPKAYSKPNPTEA